MASGGSRRARHRACNWPASKAACRHLRAEKYEPQVGAAGRLCLHLQSSLCLSGGVAGRFRRSLPIDIKRALLCVGAI